MSFKRVFCVIVILIGGLYLSYMAFTSSSGITYGDDVVRTNDSSTSTRSGIRDNVVYVDDEDRDYNYYMGLNYTSNDGTLPSADDKGIYSDMNLAHIMVTYSGLDNNNGYKGYVSLSERQDTFVYYKVLVVNDNGTPSKEDDFVTLELIDNPFTDRPVKKGFNGWTTEYNGAKIDYDSDYYTRYVNIPVTYGDNGVNSIDITMNASWVSAQVGYISNDSWSSAFGELYDRGMQEISLMRRTYVYGELDMTGYFYQKKINWRGSCSGYYDDRGNYKYNNCTCTSFYGCTYYQKINGENFDESKSYYELKNNRMSLVDNDTLERPVIDVIEERNDDFKLDSVMNGYYKLVKLNYGDSYSGYFDKNGERISGSCSSYNGCDVYELIQRLDSNGNVNRYVEGDKYFYLVTRDTNFIVMTEDSSSSWDSSMKKPFTLTSVYNGTDYRDSAKWTVYTSGWWGSGVAVSCYGDTVIENMRIVYGEGFDNGASEPTGDSNTRGVLYGRWNNVKIGRGIERNNNYITFSSVLGGSNDRTGSSNSVSKYRLMVESGYYNSLSMSNGYGSSGNSYIEGQAIYGNDYDRVSNVNDKLLVDYGASGSWGGNYYSSSNTSIGFDLTVKSGKFGVNKYDAYAGIYVGGRSGGTHNTARRVKYEGGYSYNLIGGPLTSSNRSNLNDSYLYIMGGEVDMVIGGAGRSATYGNRIIQQTGGLINYSIFGGSNGYSASNGDGTIRGSSYIFVGGNAKVGNSSYVSSGKSLYGAKAGNVFGIGNGNSSYDTIGSSDNSNIIIGGEAEISGNVYGGGNYASVGVNSNNNEVNTFIKMVGGKVYGDIYGGGNRNGSGTSSKLANVRVSMLDGEVYGSLYGGSNEKGIIYGNVDIDFMGGTIYGNLYGGGKGGYSDSNSYGTFVSRNARVVIGDNLISKVPHIIGNVYGGSSFGSVNGSSNNNGTSSYQTSVVVNRGKIDGSLFGGGEGDTSYTPNVFGNVSVVINDGEINRVFGANDKMGSPLGDVSVVINGGTCSEVYGGGNKTPLAISDVTVNGGNVTSLYGGSNEMGDVDSANVVVKDGNIGSLYGGNNIGGMTSNSIITTMGGNIGSLYGGGNLADTNNSYLYINDGVISSLYGGGESANILNGSMVNFNGGDVTSLYGGSNILGDVKRSDIVCSGGKANDLYGGNNAGGKTDSSNIVINGCRVNNLYGGGNQANTGSSYVTINSNRGEILNVYGGGNQASVNDTTVNFNGGNVSSLYGGSNKSGDVVNSLVRVDSNSSNSDNGIVANVTYTARKAESYESSVYGTFVTVNVELVNNLDRDIPSYFGHIYLRDSQLFANYSQSLLSVNGDSFEFSEVNNYYGTNVIRANSSYSFSFTALTKQSVNDVIVSYSFSGMDSNSNVFTDKSGNGVEFVYGGNNIGGKTSNSDVRILNGNAGYVYGGGNQAFVNNPKVLMQGGNVKFDIYGGGNQAPISGNTDVDILGGVISRNVYGGGNAGTLDGNSDVIINGGNVLGSVYAGGNGLTAVIMGNTYLGVEGDSNILGHLFGGGNAAATGVERVNDSNSVVDVAGGNIGGNLYGGANTSVVYGVTRVNIGHNVISNSNLTSGDIVIGGTVFGGGEANASGSSNYDYSFISVTKGINIRIDGDGHSVFSIGGSIFGSGNASSTTGYSYVDIDNYGTFNNPKRNISVQRADRVTLRNSAIVLSGATDRTNEYSDVLFTFSRIKELNLRNNSSLFLETGANLLEKFNSGLEENGNVSLASVVISENGEVTKNVDNRIYMLEGKNLNVATNENVTAYGKVRGMSFLGMYVYDRNGNPATAMYSPNYNNGDILDSSQLYYFTSGSYVLGMHEVNHNTEVNGFYSNFGLDDGSNGIEVRYIKPVPEDSNYYMWSIGEQIASYEVNLIASKYLSLGTVELPLRNNYSPNSTFSIVGFNYDNLDSGISLINGYDVPRVAESSSDADNIMGLSLKSGSGFITNGSTSFVTDSGNGISGTNTYLRENTSGVPSLVFYLYHSKNLSSSCNMGSVTISLLVSTPIDDLNNDVERVNVVVNLSRALFTNKEEYEATIAPSKHYEMFATTDVNITDKGSFSAYYSLYWPNSSNPYKNGDHRSLVSNYLFPVNTKITMIDLASRDVPEYYYYVVTSDNFNERKNEYDSLGEVSYDFGSFVNMGSVSDDNVYSDSSNNLIYYDSSKGSAHEEFIFLVDFGDASIESDVLDRSLLVELRSSDNRTIVNVMGASQSSMFYSVYAGKGATIDVEAGLSEVNVYPGSRVNLSVKTNFTEQFINSEKIVDTSFDSMKLGVMLSFIDSDGNIVTGASLMGFSFVYRGNVYYPRLDGTTRINLASRVANVSSSIGINTTGSLAPGEYKLVISSFGSYDGIYYGLKESNTEVISFRVLNTLYGLDIDMRDEMMVIDKDTGNTLLGNNKLVYLVNYDSLLDNPSIRVSLFRRDYDSVYANSYSKVDLLDYVSNSYVKSGDMEYILLNNPGSSTNIFMDLRDNLVTGTYRLVFGIYDGDKRIGEVYRYLFIK